MNNKSIINLLEEYGIALFAFTLFFGCFLIWMYPLPGDQEDRYIPSCDLSSLHVGSLVTLGGIDMYVAEIEVWEGLREGNIRLDGSDIKDNY